MERDPLGILEDQLRAIDPHVDVERFRQAAQDVFDRAWTFARDSPLPEVSDIGGDVRT
jgi:hypothetical protein